MPRIIVIILLFLIIVTPVNAQAVSPVPTPTGFWNFITNLFDLVKENKTDETVSEHRKKILPFGINQDFGGVNIKVTPNPTTGENPVASFHSQQGSSELEILSRDYANIHTVNQDPADLNTFLSSILAFFQKLFGQGVVDVGNENAQNFYNALLPQGEGEKQLARTSKPNELAQGGNSNILGTQVSDTAMANAYPLAKCTNLPFGVGNCSSVVSSQTNIPAVTLPVATPPPAVDLSEYASEYPLPNGPLACRKKYGHDYIASPVSLPDICYEMPDRYDLGSSAFSNGTCRIPNKGFCSPGCLKPFFNNNQTMAEKAAMICYKESRGDLYVKPNRGCFDGISNEYSVGLFQINLKNEDTNPYTRDPRSYQCWDAVESTGGIRCREGDRFNFCTRKFQAPEVNIPEAWNLWFDREIYYTDICTVENPGGVRWIWRGWSVAYPPPQGFCDIKY